MEVTLLNIEQLYSSLSSACSSLKGRERRLFLSQLALDLGECGQQKVASLFKVSRDTLRKGIKELTTGNLLEDKFHQRGRKPLEERQLELLLSIQSIVDGASQTDPDFSSTRLYTRLSANELKTQLLKKGYSLEELPTNQTLYNKMKSLGYKRKKVAKTNPKKR